MAWFGESIANITGQISNFTKEVLAESPEDDEQEKPHNSNGIIKLFRILFLINCYFILFIAFKR
jgi:hypothetical protein